MVRGLVEYISVDVSGWMSAAASPPTGESAAGRRPVKVGLDRTYTSGIERKVKNPTVVVVERITKALECSLGDLLD